MYVLYIVTQIQLVRALSRFLDVFVYATRVCDGDCG